MLNQLMHLISGDVSGTLVQLFFMGTILLMIRDAQKPPILTSLLTGLALILLGAGGSFRASMPAILSVLNGLLWLVLTWQRFKQPKKSEEIVIESL